MTANGTPRYVIACAAETEPVMRSCFRMPLNWSALRSATNSLSRADCDRRPAHG